MSGPSEHIASVLLKDLDTEYEKIKKKSAEGQKCDRELKVMKVICKNILKMPKDIPDCGKRCHKRTVDSMSKTLNEVKSLFRNGVARTRNAAADKKFNSNPVHRARQRQRMRNRRRLEHDGVVRKGDNKHVHHANFNPDDNRASNLRVMSAERHRALHRGVGYSQANEFRFGYRQG